MGRHGRQRLLSPRRSGQAMIEIVPAILIFAMVISAALRYFEIFRNAVESEQVARNLIMAKIANSGTLTTPASQLNNPLQPTPSDRSTRPVTLQIEGAAVPVVENNIFVDPGVVCFSVYPPDWKRVYSTSQIFVYGGSAERPPVQIMTYASICRRSP
jgi:hypothetical protein